MSYKYEVKCKHVRAGNVRVLAFRSFGCAVGARPVQRARGTGAATTRDDLTPYRYLNKKKTAKNCTYFKVTCVDYI